MKRVLVLAGLLILAACSSEQTVPDVIGLTADEAQITLEDAGYEADIVDGYHASAELGEVFDQDPREGVEHESELPVQVFVAQFRPVPNVVGLMADEAESVLEEAGYAVEIGEAYHESAEMDEVIDQDPDSGAEGDVEVPVQITITSYRSVPDVIGLTLADAQAALEEAGYAVRIDEDYDEDADIGDVIEQRPRGGAEHDPDRPVQIVVAREFLSPPIDGLFLLRGDSRSVSVSGDTCQGDSGYGDIHSATQVVVKNESGTVLGTTTLGAGELISSGQCLFEFNLPSLPRANFYVFEVARRGELTYSLQELESRNWTFEAVLGSE